MLLFSRSTSICTQIWLERMRGNKLKNKIWIIFITLLISVMSINSQANEVLHQSKRVPAEWEPQEAIWMQWPGFLEKDYEMTFANIADIVSL